MIRTGTCHFVSIERAALYYAAQESVSSTEGYRIALRKYQAGEIRLGEPALKPGETLSINEEEGRYFTESK